MRGLSANRTRAISRAVAFFPLRFYLPPARGGMELCARVLKLALAHSASVKRLTRSTPIGNVRRGDEIV